MAKIKSNNGIYIPEKIQHGRPLHFAIANIDFRNDTADGKGEVHGTTQVIFQKEQDFELNCLKIIPSVILIFVRNPLSRMNFLKTMRSLRHG